MTTTAVRPADLHTDDTVYHLGIVVQVTGEPVQTQHPVDAHGATFAVPTVVVDGRGLMPNGAPFTIQGNDLAREHVQDRA